MSYLTPLFQTGTQISKKILVKKIFTAFFTPFEQNSFSHLVENHSFGEFDIPCQ